MAPKHDDKRKPQKKLTLSKKTIRDLTPAKNSALALKGGLPPTFQIQCI